MSKLLLDRLEQQRARRAPDGRYGCDDQTGATGPWGGTDAFVRGE